MSCQKMEILLSAYIDGEVTSEEKHVVETHLRQCPACQAVVAEFSRVHLLYQEMEEKTAPRDFRQHVTQRLEARSWSRLPWRLPRLVYVLSLAVIVLFAGILFKVYFAPSTPSSLEEFDVYAEDILFGQTSSSFDDLFSTGDVTTVEEMLDTIDDLTETNSSLWFEGSERMQPSVVDRRWS